MTAARAASTATRTAWRWRGYTQLVLDLQRLNHILIPQTKEERDRWRRSRTARALRGIAVVAGRLSNDGQMVAAFAAVAAVFAVDVGRSDVYLAWAALTGLLVASAATASRVALPGVRAEVVLPHRVTVHEEAAFVVRVRNDGPEDQDTLVVRGAFLPWDGSWVVGRAELPRLRRGEEGSVELRARFSARGDHHLDALRLQALVPLGLSLGPAVETDGVRFLVVPRAANVVSLPTPLGRRQQSGAGARAVRLSDARELVGVRPYRFGDPARDLHARTWARVGEPVVREYREEFYSRVAIILDTDAGDAPDEDFEAAVSLTAGVAARLAHTEAILDVLIAGRTPRALTVGPRPATIDRVLELLAHVEPEGAVDAGALGALTFSRLASIASVVFVTLRWDAPRRAFAREIRTRGAACTPILVSPTRRRPDPAALETVSVVAPDLVRRGGEVAL